MNIQTDELIDAHILSQLRESYLSSLPQSQELFLEVYVRKAVHYKLCFNQKLIGYCSVHDKDLLVEWYIMPSYLRHAEQAFARMVHQHSLKKVYLTSFDSLTLKYCLSYGRSTKLINHLYRQWVGGAAKSLIPQVEARTATQANINTIVAIGGHRFTSLEDVEATIQSSSIKLFYRNNELVGYGTCEQVIPQMHHYDIGVAVAPKARGRYYGTAILNYLYETCMRNNWTPSVCCSVDDIALQRTAEKAGFVSRYGLLETTL